MFGGKNSRYADVVWQRTTWRVCVLKASCPGHTASARATLCSPTRFQWPTQCWHVAVMALFCWRSKLASNSSSSRTSCRTTPFQVDFEVCSVFA